MRNRFDEPCLCGVSSEAETRAGFVSSLQYAFTETARRLAAPFDRVTQAYGSARETREQERLNRTRLG